MRTGCNGATRLPLSSVTDAPIMVQAFQPAPSRRLESLHHKSGTTMTADTDKPVHYSDEDVSARERPFSGSVSGWIVLPALFAAAVAVVVFLTTMRRFGPSGGIVIAGAVVAGL